MPRSGPVLLVTYSGAFGGAERALLEAAAALAGGRLLACPEGPLAAAARAASVPVVLLPRRPLEARARPVAALCDHGAHAWEIRRLARDAGAGTVVAWGARSALAATLLGEHDGVERIHQHSDLPTGRGLALVLRLAARRADRVWVSSPAMARALDISAEVIPPGIDLRRFPVSALPPGPPRVAVVGALVGWKRPDLALEAVARIPGARLEVAGAPFGEAGAELERTLRARAAAPDLAGRVTFLGETDPAALLPRCHALFSASERESFGVAVAEAMAAGRPVAVARAGALPDLVDERCGVLFPPGDAAAAARALGDALARPALGSAGRARIRERYAAPAVRDRYRAALPQGPAPGGAGIALVTVTHDSEPDLRRLLASVSRHLPAARVVVVDAGSADGSVAAARALGAEVLELENVGFGRATNAGLARVTEPVAILVNPDVELVDASWAVLAHEAAARDAILAPALLRPGGGREASAHPPPLSPAGLALAVAPPALLPHRLRVAVEPFRAAEPRRVGWAVGAALAARTDVLRRLGPFDPGIFMYGEDLELGLRAGRAGIPTVFWPGARAIHHQGHASARAWGGEPFERLARARRAAIRRHHGRPGRALDDLAQAVTLANRIGLKRALGRDASRERAQLGALRAAQKSPS